MSSNEQNEHGSAAQRLFEENKTELVRILDQLSEQVLAGNLAQLAIVYLDSHGETQIIARGANAPTLVGMLRLATKMVERRALT